LGGYREGFNELCIADKPLPAFTLWQPHPSQGRENKKPEVLKNFWLFVYPNDVIS
jgi:hypothetical protein